MQLLLKLSKKVEKASCRKDCMTVSAEAVPPCQLAVSELTGTVRHQRVTLTETDCLYNQCKSLMMP